MATKLVLATRNPGKVEELEKALSGLDYEIIPVSEIPGAPEIEETANTLEGNARLKSETIFEYCGIQTLADDTGLEVTALDGQPGVLSARYAGKDGDAEANRAKLLKEMSQHSDRTAQFRTVMSLTSQSGTLFFEGTCLGEILRQEKGSYGFGYDPIFRPANENHTFAEMDLSKKNEISHRGKAMEKVVAHLKHVG